MRTILQTRLGLRAGAACVAAVFATGLSGQTARAGDLPPPQIRARTAVRTSAPVRARTPLRTPQASKPARSMGTTPRRVPQPAFMSGKPSEPVVQRNGARHSTYVPPVGASARRPAPAQRTEAMPRQARTRTAVPARERSGRVPVTTFRIAPAPTPRRVGFAPTPRRTVAPTPRRVSALPRVSAPAMRRTTWSPRPVPVAPATRNALPAPAVAKVSPSYADLERTRAQSVTARHRPQASSVAHRRTLQRRPTSSTLKRRAVRSRDLSVPMAPGQCAPRTPVRRSLPLVPPPGCDGGG